MANFFKSFTIKTKYGALAATAAPIIIFSGIYLAWGYASRALRKKRPVLPRSISMGVLHGGKLALQRLINYHEARADATISDRAVNELKSALKEGYPNFSLLQVRRLSTSISQSFFSRICITSRYLSSFFIFFLENIYGSQKFFKLSEN